MSNFSTNQNHPLIPNNQNYRLDRKLISVHSEDRDILKWKDANYFEVDLPCELKNIVSLRLIDIQLPANYYVFTDNYQNTKLTFTIEPTNSVPPEGIGGNRDVSQFNELNNRWNNGNGIPYIATINEGFFTPDQLALEVAGAMNNAVETYLKSQSVIVSDYQYFKCLYNDNDLKLYIGNTIDTFNLTFDNSAISYDPRTCADTTPANRLSGITNPGHGPRAWDYYTHWGLGSYLGFKRFEYNKDNEYNNYFTDACGVEFYGLGYNLANDNGWLTPDASGYTVDNPVGMSYYYKAVNTLNIYGDGQIYMELDKYNSMDEIEPYANNSNAFDNNCVKYHGKNVKVNNNNNSSNCLNKQKSLTRTSNGVYNAAFAKIPMFAVPNERIFTSGNAFLTNVYFSEPPVARIKKFKAKFRYHDGRLVDFRGGNLSYTIEANELKNEINKQYDVRVPSHYVL